MKLWDKGTSVDKRIEDFTVGNDRDFDLLLAPYDVQGSKAHAKMLRKIGLLEENELEQLLHGLDEIYKDIQQGNFVIEEDVEDVHSQIELELTRKYGEVGKKIHAGRSRNDQVLVDLKLFYKERIVRFRDQLINLIELLLDKSQANKHVLLPGYTHLQIAMPSSFGLWFGAYAETLIDDVNLLAAVYRICNQNPLGSAAGYGSSFPLDRQMTTRELGFEDLNYNAVHAQMGRGKMEQFLAFAMAAIGATLGKMAMDVCLFNSQNFGFLRLPEKYTTGSSIMPHKKNPDVFEIIRGHCNGLMALPNQVQSITTNLPSGYHRDLQLLKEVIFPSLHTLDEVLAISIYGLDKIEVKKHILKDQRYKNLFSVEAVNTLVLQGHSFREAYKMVGDNLDQYVSTPGPDSLQHTHEGSIGNLCTSEVHAKLKRVLALFG